MESSPEFDPPQEIAQALTKLKIDYKAAGFTKENAIQIFQNYSTDNSLDFQERQHYKYILRILLASEGWWKTQLVQDPTKKVRKEGMIKEIDPATVDGEPIGLPPGFEWDTIDATDDA